MTFFSVLFSLTTTSSLRSGWSLSYWAWQFWSAPVSIFDRFGAFSPVNFTVPLIEVSGSSAAFGSFAPGLGVDAVGEGETGVEALGVGLVGVVVLGDGDAGVVIVGVGETGAGLGAFVPLSQAAITARAATATSRFMSLLLFLLPPGFPEGDPC